MYQREYNQSYGQDGSYNQYHGNYGGYNSYAPPSPRIVLDDYNSDLNFVVDPGGVTGSSLHENGFEYMWAGARATHGVRAGKVCFEVRVLEKLPVTMPETETKPHVVRVGWSVDEANLQVGEDKLSYGYGGTGKVSVNNNFFDYGEPYSTNDTICCCVDLDANPKVVLFTKNGKDLGVAFRLGAEASEKAFFPHVTVNNMRLTINFGQHEPYFPPLQGFSFLSRLPPQCLQSGSAGPVSRSDCEVIMMVGLPAAGKTVWAEKYARDHPEKKFCILGTNSIMDKMKVMGLMRKRNYHGRWDALIKQATDILNKTFKIAERKNRNYILDQTNVYFSARRRKMNNFRGYRRIADVVVNTNEVLKERALKSEQEEGKVVPESAVMEMKANFVLPEVDEIFEDVWYIEEDKNNSELLVAEFQSDGKAFKENENKRKPEEIQCPSSDVKRYRAVQQGSSMPLPSGSRGQYPAHNDRGGFQGNYHSRGASSNVLGRVYPPRSQGAPGRPSTDFGPPLGHTKPRDRYRKYRGGPPQGYSEHWRPREPYEPGPQNRGIDYGPSYRQQEGYGGNYGHNQGPSHDYSPYQTPSNDDARYNQSAPAYGQHYGHYYGSQNSVQLNPRDRGFYGRGGQVTQGGRTDQNSYGGGY
ncbi:heterogeneous nuclear ribonucleoprotein U-like protein 1 [Stylophora pistillata]|uniref:Heterogeneous nuclear ribonucleoprotein U-like protein 1 n=1 Tax=Stylophora pistillata TaxID=50429 RepID=A0A2B4SG14_STYPI|nr:heterogeneous nuclear ribonucleoprotein U-like protein 1 [Stylophora pistillata]PFX28039.1 Heterogeneous nuclear ribonucleoprotein U-like protein 1 [Stylophora pistillata]